MSFILLLNTFINWFLLHCVSKKSHLWFVITLIHVNALFFGRTVTNNVSNQKALCRAISNNVCFCTTWQNRETQRSHFFTQTLHQCISRIQPIAAWFFMVALWNRADHIYFHAVVCSFFFFLFFIPRLISAAADWLSAILPHRTQKSRQKSPSGHHRTTLSGYIFATKARIDNWKKPVKQQYVLHMSPQYGELRPTSGWDRFTSLGYPCKFPLVLCLGSVTARHLVVGVSHTLRCWTEGATYIRQGDHHVGHWPTLRVFSVFDSQLMLTLLHDLLHLVINAFSTGLLERAYSSREKKLRASQQVDCVSCTMHVHQRAVFLNEKMSSF